MTGKFFFTAYREFIQTENENLCHVSWELVSISSPGKNGAFKYNSKEEAKAAAEIMLGFLEFYDGMQNRSKDLGRAKILFSKLSDTIQKKLYGKKE